MLDFVTIDFETANNNLNSACSIGLVVVKDLEIVKQEYYLIKPPTDYFSNDNIAIHGITYNDIKDCEQFPGIWDKIKDYFSEVIIAHNSQFDMSVLKNLFETYHIQYSNFVYIDSITISNSVCDCGTSLADRAAYFGIDIGEHHNALDDAITCAKVVINSIKSFGSNSFLNFVLRYNRLLPKEFKDIKANKSMVRTKSNQFQHIKISDLVATTTEFNANHPFYNKSIVLTGELATLERKEAMQQITDVGGIIKSGVSKKTDYLIVGKQDKDLVGDDGLSTKEEKAYTLIQEGCNIKIITEDEFLKLLNS